MQREDNAITLGIFTVFDAPVEGFGCSFAIPLITLI
jgi:hypothetical protein